MKNDDREVAALLRQMGRLAIPLLPPEREASRDQQTASSVNLLVQRLSGEPELRRLPNVLWAPPLRLRRQRRSGSAHVHCHPRSMLPGTPRGARVVALNGLKVPE